MFELIDLFDNKETAKDILNIDLSGISLCMSSIQINKFILNRKEYPNDFMVFQQAKTELWARIQALNDLYFQYKKANAEIKLANAEIIDLQLNKKISLPIKEAKTELQLIEIDQKEMIILNIKKQANEKLKEAKIFQQTYSKYKHFEEYSQEELDKEELEGWMLRSLYNTEFQERYGLSINGFTKLIHEDKTFKEIKQLITES